MANEQSAFFPNGPTVVITANSSAPAAVIAAYKAAQAAQGV